MTTLYTKRDSVRRAAHGILSEGKRVQLVVGPLESQSQIRFTVHKAEDLPSQIDLAFTEMREKSLAGIKVEELSLSSE